MRLLLLVVLVSGCSLTAEPKHYFVPICPIGGVMRVVYPDGHADTLGVVYRKNFHCRLPPDDSTFH